MLARFFADRRGATAVEYAIIIGVLSTLIVGGISLAFDSVEWLFTDSTSKVNTALN